MSLPRFPPQLLNEKLKANPQDRIGVFQAIANGATVLNTFVQSSTDAAKVPEMTSIKFYHQKILHIWTQLGERMHEPVFRDAAAAFDKAVAAYHKIDDLTEYLQPIGNPQKHGIQPFYMDRILIPALTLVLHLSYQLVHVRGMMLDGATADLSDGQEEDFERLEKIGRQVQYEVSCALKDLDRDSMTGLQLWWLLGMRPKNLDWDRDPVKWRRQTVWPEAEDYEDEESDEEVKGKEQSEKSTTGGVDQSTDSTNGTMSEAANDRTAREISSIDTSDDSSESDSSSCESIPAHNLLVGRLWSRFSIWHWWR